MSIENRVTAGFDFAEIVEMFGLKDKEDPSYRERLVELFVELLGPPRVTPSQVFVMNPMQARVFSAEAVPFGKYKGETYGSVYEKDPDYLAFIADQGTQLAAYLRAQQKKEIK